MSQDPVSVEVATRFRDLLDYAHHLGKINEKPVCTLSEYKQLTLWEHETLNKVGISHDIKLSEGATGWLRLERLKRISPPEPKEKISEWLQVSNDPEKSPVVHDKIIKTISAADAQQMLNVGEITERQVTEPLAEAAIKANLKDVVYYLSDDPAVKNEIDQYILEEWSRWAEQEKPRRASIKIYDSLFSLQQSIEAQSDEQPVELVWGIGIARWNYEGHPIDHPLLEQLVEIDVDKTGALTIVPRNSSPALYTGAFFKFDNPGVDALIRFEKKFFSELSDDVDFSPYNGESYEGVLRQAASQLSESGLYWPDTNPDKANRKPNPISSTLEVTDSWVFFARPRRATNYIEDINRFKAILEDGGDLPVPAKRLVSELSTERYVDSGSKSGVDECQFSEKHGLYFPKAFNSAQVRVVDRLEHHDGVVVQGPPGTGKTHTIANIVCHYLALGRRVLVTSKGEPALSVLQNQIPEELRPLTISLLSNERKGMKQLEGAVQTLAGIVSQTNLRDLNQQATANENRVKQLEQEITRIDQKLLEWGERQLTLIRKELTLNGEELSAMDLAKLVTEEQSEHSWFPDKVNSSLEFPPNITNEDVAKIREARRRLGQDLHYVRKKIIPVGELPDPAVLMAIHHDLVSAHQLERQAASQKLPTLSFSVENAVERANNLLPNLKKLRDFLEQLSAQKWLAIFYRLGVNGDEAKCVPEKKFFDELYEAALGLAESRDQFVLNHVEIADLSSCFSEVEDALQRLVQGKKPFGFLKLSNKAAQPLIQQTLLNGSKPTTPEEWQIVLDYVHYQDQMRKFFSRWNHVGQELGLPNFSYAFGEHFKDFFDLLGLIKLSKNVETLWPNMKAEISILFPYGVSIDELPYDLELVVSFIKTISDSTSCIALSSRRSQLSGLIDSLQQCTGQISERLLAFVKNRVGDENVSADEIGREWQELLSEVKRIHSMALSLDSVDEVAQKIFDAGAKNWSAALCNDPLIAAEDIWTPDTWFSSWKWSRCRQYLEEIDGRTEIRVLSERRKNCASDLQKVFSELVQLKTSIGLQSNMTERVQGALMRFVSAVSKIGKGTGKRAPRHRKDAYRAMQDCYDGVPCWIMPAWRISESLPSEFGSFDLVIIDEASQSDITNALPAILRAKKVLVVGDDKQVSPTAAFIPEESMLKLKHNFLSSQPNAQLLMPGVSVYDLAASIFPSQRIMLTEHFRCVEPIIRFSMQFYAESLVPLRIPKGSEKITPPLVDIFVPGAKRDERRKVNELEAEAIVEEIKLLINDPKFTNRSMGVVSLVGAQQAKYIQDLLLREIGEEVFERHCFACGDAATFQGKERDIMFISMVVGAKQGAAMTKREDEQRMNVALSRARDRMYLFRSVREADLKNEADLRLKILRHFANPMSQLDVCDEPVQLCDSDFERDVYIKLVELGYQVTPQVKVGAFSIDLVVEGENDRRLAVELDGDKYHPKEKWMDDWKRQRVMERVGWKFWRCWGSSYTIDPDGCLKDLTDLLSAMKIYPHQGQVEANIYSEFREYKSDLKFDEMGEGYSLLAIQGQQADSLQSVVD